MNALEANLAQSPTVPELLASPGEVATSPAPGRELVATSSGSMPVARADDVAATLGRVAVDGYMAGAAFARRPNRYYDDPNAYVDALVSHAGVYARGIVEAFAQGMASRIQEGNTTDQETP
jgi:hypothetical protein